MHRKISCSIELLDMSASGIHIAEYWTQLLPLEIFKKKIQEIVLQTKLSYENKESSQMLQKELK